MVVDGADLLIRPASKRILEALLAGRRSLTELSAATGVAKPSLLPTLRRLTEFGWIKREEVRAPTGREVYYSLQAGSLHLELRPETGVAIAWVGRGSVDDLFPLASQVSDPATRAEVLVALKLLRSKMRGSFEIPAFSIILFGSAARGQITWKSDIDFLFVMHRDGDPNALYDNIVNHVADLQEFVTHPVRAHVVELDDFMQGKGTIAKEAANEGIVLFARRETPLWSKMGRYRAISI